MKISERLASLTPDQIKEARSWISECSWADIESSSELTDLQVTRGIARHYAGGWPQFLSDSVPVYVGSAR